MARGKSIYLPAVVLLLLAFVAGNSGDRSPYVPDPVTYPGLLPQFTSTTPGPAVSGGANQQRPATARPTSQRPPSERPPRPTTTTHPPAVEEGGDNGLGDRIGEQTTQRPPQRPAPRPPQTQQPCDPVGVPCYDCVVYISRTGQITRFYPSRENLN